MLCSSFHTRCFVFCFSSRVLYFATNLDVDFFVFILLEIYWTHLIQEIVLFLPFFKIPGSTYSIQMFHVSFWKSHYIKIRSFCFYLPCLNLSLSHYDEFPGISSLTPLLSCLHYVPRSVQLSLKFSDYNFNFQII